MVIHCGMTKTGSTTIQTVLRNHAETLSEHGLTTLVDSCDSASGQVYLPDASTFLEPSARGSSLININSFYYQYRRRRANAGVGSAQRILGRLKEAILEKADTRGTVVVSGESLEASLAYRDDLLANVLQELADSVDVELVVFTRAVEDHVLSSWQEFSWARGEPLDVWIGKYRDRVAPRVFWSDLSQPYFADLIRFEEWVPFWRETGLALHVVPLSTLLGQDSSAYFFEQLLGATGLVEARQTANVGWPPSLLRVLPRLSSAFKLDYARFQRVRDVLGDYPLDRDEGNSVKSAALGVIGDALSPRLFDSTRRSEGLLGLPEGALGLSTRGKETESDAMDAVRAWQEPTTTEWVHLSYALLGHVLFKPSVPSRDVPS